MSKNFIHVKQRKTGDLNQRFEPPVKFYFNANLRGSGEVFRYAQSDVVLKHSDVLHLPCKVMLSLLFTAPTDATSL